MGTDLGLGTKGQQVTDETNEWRGNWGCVKAVNIWKMEYILVIKSFWGKQINKIRDLTLKSKCLCVFFSIVLCVNPLHVVCPIFFL